MRSLDRHPPLVWLDKRRTPNVDEESRGVGKIPSQVHNTRQVSRPIAQKTPISSPRAPINSAEENSAPLDDSSNRRQVDEFRVVEQW